MYNDNHHCYAICIFGLTDSCKMRKSVIRNQYFVCRFQGRIVLLGFGSGAVCVTFHMANPISNTYFDRVFLSGGSALSPDGTGVLVLWPLGAFPKSR